jgi:hypothetical protein
VQKDPIHGAAPFSRSGRAAAKSSQKLGANGCTNYTQILIKDTAMENSTKQNNPTSAHSKQAGQSLLA